MEEVGGVHVREWEERGKEKEGLLKGIVRREGGACIGEEGIGGKLKEVQ